MQSLFIQKPFKIIHIDMDCFYAQIEERDNPSLKGKPVAVGGPSRSKGVLCTSNYEARKFGVRSAQPTFQAVNLCPDLILVPPDFSKYKAASTIIQRIFLRYTQKVQQVSLDEAYLDVTHTQLFGGSATLIAKAIKADIYKETGLTASAGVSCNKLLAKIASDWEKPNGLFTITPDQREAFIKPLPLKKIPGVGKVSNEKLKTMGFSTCGDISSSDLYKLIDSLGKRRAIDLYRNCLGISNSLVKSSRLRKSISVERTFFEGLVDIEHEVMNVIAMLESRLENLSEIQLENRMISHIYIKSRYQDFTNCSREILLDEQASLALQSSRLLTQRNKDDVLKTVQALKEAGKQQLRLIGVGLRFKDRRGQQLSLDL